MFGPNAATTFSKPHLLVLYNIVVRKHTIIIDYFVPIKLLNKLNFYILLVCSFFVALRYNVDYTYFFSYTRELLSVFLDGNKLSSKRFYCYFYCNADWNLTRTIRQFIFKPKWTETVLVRTYICARFIFFAFLFLRLLLLLWLLFIVQFFVQRVLFFSFHSINHKIPSSLLKNYTYYVPPPFSLMCFYLE